MSDTRREEILKYMRYKTEEAQDNNPYHAGPKRWAHHELWLIDNNVPYETVHHGYLLENKYVITAQGRWKIKGKDKWYWYSTLDKLLDKIGIKYYE